MDTAPSARVRHALLPRIFLVLAKAVLAAAIYGATFIGIVGLTLALAGRRCPANPARVMARLTLSYGAAQMLAPALASAIAGAKGSYKGALFLAAAVMVAGIVLLALLQHKGGGTADASRPAAELPDQNLSRPTPTLPGRAATTTGHPRP